MNFTSTNKGAFAGVFAALLFAAALVGACGVLVESALRAHAPVERYAAADAVVTGPHDVRTRVDRLGEAPAEASRPVAERPRVPLSAAARLRAVPGVREVIADVSFPVVLADGRALTGHARESAALTGAGPRAGREPRAADEIVLGRDAGARVGETVSLRVDAEPRPFRVVGLAPSGTGSVYFAPATAAALYAHPGKADALVVLADEDLDEDALRAAVPGLDVATGDARGDAEDPSVAAARPDLLELGLSVGGVAIMTALVVVGGLIVLSVRDRTRELALLRAVGATPGQVRADLLRETARAGVPAALIGGVASLALGAGLVTAMVDEGVLPEGFGASLSPLPTLAAFAVTMLAASVTAFLASLRATRIRPVEALGVAGAEPAGLPRRRLVTGLVFLFIGVNALGFSFAATGATAAASVGGLVLALIVATAFLGPLLARAGARYLGGAAEAASPVAGRLARHASGAAALRAGSIMTPVALAVAFGGTQLFAPATVARAAHEQAAAGVRADRVLVADGPGLPHGVAAAARRAPGVIAVAPVKRTTVVMPVRELGEETLLSLGARAVGGDVAATIDPGVTDGALRDLRGTTVALGADVAGGLEVGSTAELWLGDGTRVEPRVVAIYERGHGFGDVLLPRDLVAGHTSTPLDDHVLVRTDGGADLTGVASANTGVRAIDSAEFGARVSRQVRLQGFVSVIVVAAIGGFIVIGLVTTLALATAARRREFVLLRLVGATRRQVLRALRLETLIVLGTGVLAGTLIAAVTLFAFAFAVVGLPLPAVSPAAAAAILLGVAGSGAAAVMLPARATLRRRSTPTIS
ncbi:FtsX-like permease family protein [Actinomadura algeriensis]|uniref:ABC transport system permease protein n=1 Tax=Actinomadura algeriensis TaxID=1679523 RepID=A0ABR9JYW1_9ACTN|nr:ABC transporter permease [Actinomadura algeriensis]MBE1535748.1 putative ABC transport system permease protein [Actinomadura algeriensis]